MTLRLRFGHFTENDKLWFVVNGFTLHVCPYLGLKIPGSGRANLHDIDVRLLTDKTMFHRHLPAEVSVRHWLARKAILRRRFQTEDSVIQCMFLLVRCLDRKP